MLSLHGVLGSTYTNIVFIVLLQVGLKEGQDFEIIPCKSFQEVSTDEWKEKQPFGEMPYLVDSDNGLVIYESRAISRYIAAKYQSDLLPPTTDLATYAKFEIGASVEGTNFNPPATTLFIETYRKSYFGGTTDHSLVEEAERTLQKKLEGYERVLATQAYIGGDRLTLADIFHLPVGYAITHTGQGRGLTDGSLPRVQEWWAKISSIDSFSIARARLQGFYDWYAEHAKHHDQKL